VKGVLSPGFFHFVEVGPGEMIDKIQQVSHLARIALGTYTDKKTYCGPLWVQIGISNRCNYRCVMCWDHPSFVEKDDPYPDHITSKYYRENPSVDRTSSLMDFALFENLVNDLYAMGTRRIDIVGRGEPFLNSHIVEMVSFVKKKKMYCSIATNGSKLTGDVIKHLIEEGLDHLIVSLNAGRPETYGKIHTSEDELSFHKIKESLIHLNELQSRLGASSPSLALSFVLSKDNFKEARDMMALAQEVGAPEISFKHAVLYDGINFLGLSDSEKLDLDRELLNLEKQALRTGINLKFEPPIGTYVNAHEGPPSPLQVYGKIPCYVGWLFALITADGTVLPCCHCFAKMGNIKDNSFREIWWSGAYREYRERTKNLPKSKGIVPNCRCDLCAYIKFNLSLYNCLHPFNKRIFYEGQREYSVGRLLSSLISKEVTYGPKQL